MTCSDGNPSPGLEQARKCGGVDGMPTLPLWQCISNCNTDINK